MSPMLPSSNMLARNVECNMIYQAGLEQLPFVVLELLLNQLIKNKHNRAQFSTGIDKKHELSGI